MKHFFLDVIFCYLLERALHKISIKEKEWIAGICTGKPGVLRQKPAEDSTFALLAIHEINEDDGATYERRLSVEFPSNCFDSVFACEIAGIYFFRPSRHPRAQREARREIILLFPFLPRAYRR